MWLRSARIKELEKALEVQSKVVESSGQNLMNAMKELQKAISEKAKKDGPNN